MCEIEWFNSTIEVKSSEMPTSRTSPPYSSAIRRRNVGRNSDTIRSRPPLRPQPEHRRRAGSIRYPDPTTVSMIAGSPSLRRNVIIVTRTVVVKGSAFSSHTRSSSSSLLTTAPCAVSSVSSTPNSLRVSSIGSPCRVTVRLPGSSSMSPAVSTGGAAGVVRRPSARTRATSSANANGLGR